LTGEKSMDFTQTAMEIARNRAYDGNPPKFIPGIDKSSYN